MLSRPQHCAKIRSGLMSMGQIIVLDGVPRVKGRPVITDTVIKAVYTFAKNGLQQTAIAAAIGVSVPTLNRWLKQGSEHNTLCSFDLEECVDKCGDVAGKRFLANVFNKASYELQDSLLRKINDASNIPQHWQAAAWLLERRFPNEFGKKEIKEHRGEVKHKHKLEIPTEKRKQIAESLKISAELEEKEALELKQSEDGSFGINEEEDKTE